MPRPILASVDISALQHNLRIAKARAPHAKVWAVVKANAYGHGLERGVRAFAEADGLALIEPDYAVQLRELGWKKPILLLEGFFDADDLDLVISAKLETTVHCDEQIALLEHALPKQQVPYKLSIHLKMNSGMNRLGFAPEAFRAAYQRLRAMPEIGSITLMTHLANADDPFNPGLPLEQQLARFERGIADLPGDHSVANSAADLMHPELRSDWVRPGVMLYGATPGGGTAESFGLRAAMTLTSRIIGMQKVAVGEAIGYGSRFVADEPMIVGVVACGYADGYPRHAPTGTPVIVDGVRTSTVGRVSMDMFSVDLTNVPGAHVGSEVVLWGSALSVDEVAHAAGTIGYELLCAVAPRVRFIEI
ncbi:alanine racemase [Glaciimonas sp. Gout2]|uniref:alanine racemase n=2 Tax=Glaciimonas TaxID=1229970 RepID=UPI002AB5ACA9|nr:MULTISPECIES: alanine racemase [unclassified Glaciimonas]MDY7547865.1 alanine racemase [Glaciimonas sp. CA11.2]MEB0010039.1 alanine racemase [Glaciimonas sp. Cout2]MEB0081846.1 alanine racemase [Glaciimonas sp. Gout2]